MGTLGVSRYCDRYATNLYPKRWEANAFSLAIGSNTKETTADRAGVLVYILAGNLVRGKLSVIDVLFQVR